jgi:hypothetical protein
MEPRGFVQDMLDVKVLILYVLARVQRPVTRNQLYELCYQDDKLSYFDMCEALPQMVTTGHIALLTNDVYEITDNGRDIERIMGETVAFPVAQRAKKAVEKFNRESRRSDFLRTSVRTDEESGKTNETPPSEPSKSPKPVISCGGTILSEYLYESALRCEWAVLKNEGEDTLYIAAELYLDSPDTISKSSGGYLVLNGEEKKIDPFTVIGTSNQICSTTKAVTVDGDFNITIDATLFIDITKKAV